MNSTEALMESECSRVYRVNAQLPGMQSIARTFAILAVGDIEEEYKLNRQNNPETMELAGEVLLLAAMNLLTTANNGKMEPLCLHFSGIRAKDGTTFPTQTVFLAMQQNEMSDKSPAPDVVQYISRVDNYPATAPKMTKRRGRASKSITPSEKTEKKQLVTTQSLQAQLDSQLAPELLEALRESRVGNITTEAELSPPEAEPAPTAMPTLDPVATLQRANNVEAKGDGNNG